MRELKHPYPAVAYADGPSYGGNQNRMDEHYMRRCACGVVACTDLLLYLHRYHPGCQTKLFEMDGGEGPVSEKVYNGWVRRIRNRYLPVIPYLGTFGVELALGMNRCFRREGIPLRASWGVRKARLWAMVEEMLAEDIPVILAVGANFPLPIHRHKVNFYRRGERAPACKTCAHFVVITGMDGESLWVSSWGREYEIRKQEFWDYARRHSSFFLCSILRVRPK